MAKLIAGDSDEIQALREVIRREIQSHQGGTGIYRNPYGGGYIAAFVGIADSGITARVTTTPGTGTVSLYVRDKTAGTLSDNTKDVTAYNISQTAVASGSYVMVLQDNYGDYWVMLEDCG